MKLRPADIRDLVFAGLAATIGAVLASGLPFVGVPLAASALGWLTYRHGYLVAIVASVLVAAGAVLVLRDVAASVFVGPALLVSGPGVAWALARWPAVRVVGALTLVLAVSAVGLDAVNAAAQGRSLLGQRVAEASYLRTVVIEAGKKSAPNDAATVKVIADQAATNWRIVWPSMYVWVTGLAALLAVPFVSRSGRAFGRPVSALPKLPEFDFSPHIVWPVIAGFALVAAATFLHQPVGWMQVLGLNLLLVARPVLFFQGLGDFAALYRRAGVGKVARAFGFVFLAFSETVVPSVSVLGMLDIFANLRKLPRGGTGAPAQPG